MHIVVAGASGATGRHVVEQAARAGHRVTALVRDPGRYDPPDAVTTLRADVARDPAIPLPPDTDAVISALGKRSPRDPESTCMLGIIHLAAAMRAVDTRRIVVTSAQPVLRSGAGLNALDRHVLTPLIRLWGRRIYPDLERMEAYLHSQGEYLDWTVLRPGYLRDEDKPGTFRLELDRNVPGSTFRPDLAAALLEVTGDESTYGRTYGISSRTRSGV
ncbi:hypothetical protein BJF85_02605 [Saccharomonospora sp. CUA-673]|uniref:NAD(P)-dependent oxidoreductase n=1 Tax=Saccharomonospora sp. CUA-673 TaxID=1904969 RepID=UPI000965A25C|nr:NAD(P)H-binding protein [Saccharomonospora sp. CUA-673]OLT45268.1 hypothetical protein BJF85_02605 [Saccharomonospora sp. CUA-673]